MKYQHMLWFFVLIILSACKKEYPVSSNGTPVFYFKGDINGNPVNIKAGINNYYMYSSFMQDVNNVYNFTGDLKEYNCTNCANRLQIQINDFQSSVVNAPAIIDTSLSPGYYAYQNTSGVPVYSHYFYPVIQGGNPQTYLWDFGDGTTSTVATNQHTYAKPGYYNVCLTIAYGGTAACTSSICNEVKVGVPGEACTAAFSNSPSPTGFGVSFTATSTGVGPFTYSWDFGDGNTATLSNNSAFTHSYSTIGVYKVCLKVVDSQGCTTNVCKNVPTYGFNGCVTNFALQKSTSFFNPKSFSGIIVTWTDASGIVYTSKNFAQPSDSYFRIVSVENYSPNQNNQKTQKLQINFKCKVFSSSNFLQIDNTDAVISLAYQ